MKKIIFCLALLAPIFCLLPVNKEEIPALTSKERSDLIDFYIFEEIQDQDCDYYLTLLEKHMQILRHEISTKKNGWSANSAKVGTVVAAATLSTAGFGYLIHQLWQKLSTGKFRNVNIPYTMLKDISSLKYNRSERKKLDHVTVDKVTITYEQPWEETLARIAMNGLSGLSSSESQKLVYFARSEAIREIKFGIGLAIALWTFTTAWILGPTMYEAIYYTDNLVKELERCKSLHQGLLAKKTNHLTTYPSA